MGRFERVDIDVDLCISELWWIVGREERGVVKWGGKAVGIARYRRSGASYDPNGGLGKSVSRVEGVIGYHLSMRVSE